MKRKRMKYAAISILVLIFGTNIVAQDTNGLYGPVFYNTGKEEAKDILSKYPDFLLEEEEREDALYCITWNGTALGALYFKNDSFIGVEEIFCDDYVSYKNYQYLVEQFTSNPDIDFKGEIIEENTEKQIRPAQVEATDNGFVTVDSGYARRMESNFQNVKRNRIQRVIFDETITRLYIVYTDIEHDQQTLNEAPFLHTYEKSQYQTASKEQVTKETNKKYSVRIQMFPNGSSSAVPIYANLDHIEIMTQNGSEIITKINIARNTLPNYFTGGISSDEYYIDQLTNDWHILVQMDTSDSFTLVLSILDLNMDVLYKDTAVGAYGVAVVNNFDVE